MNYGFATVHQNKTQSFVVSEVPRSSGGGGGGVWSDPRAQSLRVGTPGTRARLCARTRRMHASASTRCARNGF